MPVRTRNFAALVGAALLIALLPSVPAQAKGPLKAGFHFNTLTPGTALPAAQTVNGLTAAFSAPSEAEVVRSFTPIPGFSGNYLFLPDGALSITFDRPVSEVSLSFAALGFAGSPTTLMMNANAPWAEGFYTVGSAQSSGRRYAALGPITLSAGRLDLSAKTPFTQFTLDSTDNRPFAIDNLDATPAAVPEASTTVSLGLLLVLGLGAVRAAKRRKA